MLIVHKDPGARSTRRQSDESGVNLGRLIFGYSSVFRTPSFLKVAKDNDGIGMLITSCYLDELKLDSSLSMCAAELLDVAAVVANSLVVSD